MSYIGGNTNPGNYIGSHPVIGIASSFPSFRNKIINGNFDIWQRGTSQTSSGYGSADRWVNLHAGSTKTASQQAFTVGQTDVQGNPKYYLRHVVSSVAGTGNYCLVLQRIEGVETLAGQTATLSFWAKADSNKSIATEFLQYFGTGGSPSALVNTIGVTTHNLTTSWQKFTATVAVPSISGKTLGSDGNDRLELNFWFEAGSDFNSRTNSLVQQSGTFDIAQVQLEEGTVATPFEHRPTSVELSLAQRYFQIANICCTDYAASSSYSTEQRTPFITEMRATPTALAGSTGSTSHFNSSSNTLTAEDNRHASAQASASATGSYSSRFLNYQFSAEL